MDAGSFAPRVIRSLRASNPASLRTFTHGLRSAPRARPRMRNPMQMQTRGAKTYIRPPNRLEQMVIDARVQHPILFPLLLFGSTASVIMLTVMAYNEYRRDKAGSSAFPPAVEERLRLALHYTHISPDPEIASQYFMQAIEKADEEGMDPFGRESIGIRVRFSQMLEEFGHVKASIEILDGIVKDFEQKLAEMDELRVVVKNQPPSETEIAAAEFRSELIKGIVKLKIKMSSQYESDYVQDSTLAKQTLSDAVGLVVKESKNRPLDALTEGNGAGLSSDEIAAMLSQMGDLYATSGEEENAVQVYMLTLAPLRAACNGTRSCREVQVLSNIAATMSMALKKPNAIVNGKPATKESLAAGRRAALKWADQAIATADIVQPEDRDDICTAALLSAQISRADLLLENGEKGKAREAFLSLLPVLREKNVVPLIETAEQGLKRASS